MNMADHMVQLKSWIAKRMAMGSMFEEDIKGKILLSSLAGYNKYTHFIASVNALAENMTTLKYVTTRFMKERRRLWNLSDVVNKGLSNKDDGHGAPVTRKCYGTQTNDSRPHAGSS